MKKRALNTANTVSNQIMENLRNFHWPAIGLALDPEWEEGQEEESHDDRGLGTPFCVEVVGNRSLFSGLFFLSFRSFLVMKS